MSEFCQCNVIAPIVLLNIDPVAHELLYPLVVTFRLPISTGMKSGGNILFDMKSFAKSRMNLMANRGSRVLMIFWGSPNREKTCVRNRSTTPSAVIVSLHGMNTAILVQS